MCSSTSKILVWWHNSFWFYKQGPYTDSIRKSNNFYPKGALFSFIISMYLSKRSAVNTIKLIYYLAFGYSLKKFYIASKWSSQANLNNSNM